jgi:cytochrome c-type biogenesis protein CcmF
MTGSALWMQEKITLVHPGDSLLIAGYTLTFEGVQPVAGKNYTAVEGSFAVARHGRDLGEMHPQRRFYPLQSRFTTQAAIRTDLMADLYVTIGAVDAHDASAYVTRIYHHPLVPWIWIGAAIMTAGGIVSLFSRRRTAPAVENSLALEARS